MSVEWHTPPPLVGEIEIDGTHLQVTQRRQRFRLIYDLASGEQRLPRESDAGISKVGRVTLSGLYYITQAEGNGLDHHKAE